MGNTCPNNSIALDTRAIADLTNLLSAHLRRKKIAHLQPSQPNGKVLNLADRARMSDEEYARWAIHSFNL
jgi:hypothetical protein